MGGNIGGIAAKVHQQGHAGLGRRGDQGSSGCLSAQVEVRFRQRSQDADIEVVHLQGEGVPPMGGDAAGNGNGLVHAGGGNWFRQGKAVVPVI